MKYFEKVAAKLMLEDGRVFEGLSAGKIGTASGELCFNTGMTGYQEIFTDPSYYGQIIAMTNVHIGNYGTIEDEQESYNAQIKGLVTRNFTNLFSRHSADAEIQSYLLENNVVAITGVDTRALVSYIRDKGAMNCVISSENTDEEFLASVLSETPSMKGLELSSEVTCKEPYTVGDPKSDKLVALLDLGSKRSIINNLRDRGCAVKVFPAKSSFEEIMECKPSAFMVSNGPGDPSSMAYAIDTAKKMLETKKPFFGICLGHQIFAEAMGVDTYKMHNGHRGINHPVKNLKTGKSEITTQNHGFTVNEDQIRENEKLTITHINLNDQTIEGIEHKNQVAFSVQYHPEASPGPNDAKYLFDSFTQSI